MFTTKYPYAIAKIELYFIEQLNIIGDSFHLTIGPPFCQGIKIDSRCFMLKKIDIEL